MMPPLDVFSVRNNESTWLGPAKTLVRALEVMRQNGAGSYFIFSHQTGHKAMYQVDENGHDLTLDQVKKEARDLLRGLQRRNLEALRRYQAVDPVTDISKPALDDARFIIAREHGFSSWRKLKEHIENLRR